MVTSGTTVILPRGPPTPSSAVPTALGGIRTSPIATVRETRMATRPDARTIHAPTETTIAARLHTLAEAETMAT